MTVTSRLVNKVRSTEPSPVTALHRQSWNQGLISVMFASTTTWLADAWATQSRTSVGARRSGAGDGSTSPLTRRPAVDLAEPLLAQEQQDRDGQPGHEGANEPAEYEGP